MKKFNDQTSSIHKPDIFILCVKYHELSQPQLALLCIFYKIAIQSTKLLIYSPHCRQCQPVYMHYTPSVMHFSALIIIGGCVSEISECHLAVKTHCLMKTRWPIWSMTTMNNVMPSARVNSCNTIANFICKQRSRIHKTAITCGVATTRIMNG